VGGVEIRKSKLEGLVVLSISISFEENGKETVYDRAPRNAVSAAVGRGVRGRI